MELNLSEMRGENKRLQNLSAKNERSYNQIEVQNKNCIADKMEAIRDKFVAKNAVSALTREIEWLQKQTVAELGNIDGLIRDRDKMVKDIELVETENQNNKREIKGLETEKNGIKL